MAKVGDIDIENKVFEVTKEMLLNYGVRGWNMNDLSEKCGMSKRTLYKIIANKEELLIKCSLDTLNHNTSKIESFFQSSESYEYLLENFVEAVINMFDEFIIKNAEALTKEYPRLGEMINQKKIRTTELYGNFFKKGKELGYFVDFFDPEAMKVLFTDLIGYNVLICKTKNEFKEKMHYALKVIIRGVKK